MNCFRYGLIALLLLPVLALTANSREEIFTNIYKEGHWGTTADGEGTSGEGSSLMTTEIYRQFLQDFFLVHDIHSVVDVGCGDWEFSRAINWSGIQYYGYDLVVSVIVKNHARYAAPNINFIRGDAVRMTLPKADLLICKDVLQHLPNEDIASFIKKLRGFKYCLITNDVDPETLSSTNPQIRPGELRCLDLTQPPFSLSGIKVLTFVSGQTVKQTLLLTN